jgi:hypothetical protein
MQPLTGFQIELVDDAGDSGRRARAQRLFHGPQRVFAMRRLGEDQPTRIETERAEAMPVRPAVIAQSIGREDKNERTCLRLMRDRAGRGRVGVAGRLLKVEMVRGTTGFHLRRWRLR